MKIRAKLFSKLRLTQFVFAMVVVASFFTGTNVFAQGATASPSLTNKKNLILKANEFYAKKKWAQATLAYMQVLSLTPNDPDVITRYAVCRYYFSLKSTFFPPQARTEIVNLLKRAKSIYEKRNDSVNAAHIKKWLKIVQKVNPSGQLNAKPDYNAYIQDLQRRVKRQWYPPKGNNTQTIVVQFYVKTNGEMSHLKIVKSSNSSLADQAAMKAVKNASPFRPIPNKKKSYETIELSFDYNVRTRGARASKVTQGKFVQNYK